MALQYGIKQESATTPLEVDAGARALATISDDVAVDDSDTDDDTTMI